MTPRRLWQLTLGQGVKVPLTKYQEYQKRASISTKELLEDRQQAKLNNLVCAREHLIYVRGTQVWLAGTSQAAPYRLLNQESKKPWASLLQRNTTNRVCVSMDLLNHLIRSEAPQSLSVHFQVRDPQTAKLETARQKQLVTQLLTMAGSIKAFLQTGTCLI